MHSTYSKHVVVALGISVMGVAASLTAQQQVAADTSPLMFPGHRYDLPATLITAAQIDTHKRNMIAAKNDDAPMNMVKAGGGSDKHQVGVSVVTSNKGQKNPNYAVHDDVAEVYYILEGSGTYTTGGTIPDPKNRTAGIKGGQTNQINPGDVIIIPPGTAHWFSKINGHVTYIEARFAGNVWDPPAR